MSTSTARPSLDLALSPLTSATSREAQLAAALGCIITGRPLPAHLCPPAHAAAPCPMSVEAGIRRIVGGPMVS